jgi:hypothetical protein
MKVGQIVCRTMALSSLACRGSLDHGDRATGDWLKECPDYLGAVHHTVGLSNSIEPHGVTSLALALFNMGRLRVAPKLVRYAGVFRDLGRSKFRTMIGKVLQQF